MTKTKTVHIIGAGPSGLTAADELASHKQFEIYILDKRDKVGGISRTESYKGYYFDIGGHRFFSKNVIINAMWRKRIGQDFLTIRRITRIYFRKRFFQYPIQLWNTIFNLGPIESCLICGSYLRALLFPLSEEKTFDQWISNRFGKRLYKLFFKSYTEKVWGMPCNKIQADWAAQRIKGLSFKTAFINVFLRSSRSKSLIDRFFYPRLGPGMMWNSFRDSVEKKDGNIELNTTVISLKHTGGCIRSIQYVKNGERLERPTDYVISSAPLSQLVQLLDPAAPGHVIKSANRLSYRAFIIVVLIIDQKETFDDQWIYIHNPEVSVGRIQNFKNWSQEMVPNENTTSLGMEYFCNEGEAIWNLPDEELVKIASKEIHMLGITKEQYVIDSFVARQPDAYPVYDKEYKYHVSIIMDYLNSFTNLQTIGRGGMHRYNNMDHSMMTGILAAENIAGACNDIWKVNDDADYIEEIEGEQSPLSINMYKKIFATIGIVIGLYFVFIY